MDWPAKRMATQTGKGFGMYETAAALAADGADVIRLEVGRPAFDTPMHIKAAAKQALDDGIVHYGDLQGSAALREALAAKLARYNGLEFSADEILVTNGLTQAAFATFMAGLNDGDEVIVFEPFYPQHNPKITLVGGRVVLVPLDKAAGFRLDASALEAAITERTKMIVLINPANPVGTVFRHDELEALANIARKHDLLVLTDEVYDYIVYDDAEHISLAGLPGMRERTITLGAFTKAYAMDGWRLGYVAASERFMPALLKITMNDVAHVNVFIQDGAHAAITGPQDCLAEMLDVDRQKRDLVCQRLNEMTGVICPEPQGTIYAFPNIAATGKTSQQIADEILANSHVVTESGRFYGASGEGHLRICFGAEPVERLEQAMDRMASYFNG